MLIIWSEDATAQSSSSASTPSCTTKHRALAKKHFIRAQQYKQNKHYQDAVDEYLRAFKLCRSPSLIFNVAQAYRLGGQDVEALHYYHEYLLLDPGGKGATVAHGQLFMAAEKLWHEQAFEEAAYQFQQYLLVKSNGRHEAVVRARLKQIQQLEGDDQLPVEAPVLIAPSHVEIGDILLLSPPTLSPPQDDEIPVLVERVRPRRHSPMGGWILMGAGGAVAVLSGILQYRASRNFNSYDDEFVARCGDGCRLDDVPDLRDRLDTGRMQWKLALGGYIAAGSAIAAGTLVHTLSKKRYLNRTHRRAEDYTHSQWQAWTAIGSGALITVAAGIMQYKAVENFSRYDQDIINDCNSGCFPEETPTHHERLATARTQRRLALGGYVVGGTLAIAGAAFLYLKPLSSRRFSSLTPIAVQEVVGMSLAGTF